MLLDGVDLKSLTASLLRKWDVNDLAENVFVELVDEIILGIGFEVHRSVKTGLFPLCDSDSPDALSPPESKKMGLSSSGVDVFGSVVTTAVGVPTLKKQPECICPNCSRNLAASRFAPHLEKCMGMGRNSSRIASRRIASSSNNNSNNNSNSNSSTSSGGSSNSGNSQAKDNHHASEGGAGGGNGLEEDDAEDEDWIEPGKSFNRKKRDKNSPRRNRAPKYGNAQGRMELLSQFADGSITPPSSYDHLSKEERVHLLANICGVISHSKRVCTRSTRCQIHNDSQRREIRIKWIGGMDEEAAHVDIDSFTEGDTAALRESLSLLSNASSPAESTISNSSNPGNSRDSSSSRRSTNAKGGNRRAKRGKEGSKGGSRASTPPTLD